MLFMYLWIQAFSSFLPNQVRKYQNPPCIPHISWHFANHDGARDCEKKEKAKKVEKRLARP
jgi:hypothetical protein